MSGIMGGFAVGSGAVSPPHARLGSEDAAPSLQSLAQAFGLGRWRVSGRELCRNPGTEPTSAQHLLLPAQDSWDGAPGRVVGLGSLAAALKPEHKLLEKAPLPLALEELRRVWGPLGAPALAGWP